MELNEPQENYITGWVKVFRSFTNWEWYHDSKYVHLFIHCILKANHKDNKWQGQIIKKGTFITSLNNLSIETGISTQSIRTILKKLEMTKEITVKSTNKNRLITICNYDSYQEINYEANKQLTNNQQTTNKQLTTNKNEKNIKNEKNNIINNTEYFEILTNSESWLESVSMKHKCKVSYIKTKLEEFNNELFLRGDQKLNKNEYQSHFVSWLNKKPEIKQKYTAHENNAF